MKASLITLLLSLFLLQVNVARAAPARKKEERSALINVIEAAKEVIRAVSVDEGYAKSFFNLVGVVYAGEEPNCFYAGWPSQLEDGRCGPPLGSPEFSKVERACGTGHVACNPSLFGTIPSNNAGTDKTFCAESGNKQQKQTVFSQCEALFNKNSADINVRYAFLTKADFNHDLLKETIRLAKKVCSKDSKSKQAGTAMCEKFLNKLNELEKYDHPGAQSKKVASKADDVPSKSTRGDVNTVPQTNSKPDTKAVAGTGANDTITAKANVTHATQSAKTDCVIPTAASVDKNISTAVSDYAKTIEASTSLDDYKKQSANLAQQIAALIPADKDQANVIPSNPFNPPQTTKNKVLALSEQKVCVDLEIFKKANALDFPIDCTKKPYIYPPLKAELLKNSDTEADAKKQLNAAVANKIAKLEETIRFINDPLYPPSDDLKRIAKETQAEIDCWKTEFPARVNCDGDGETYKEMLSGLSTESKLTYYIQANGKLYPFKEVSKMMIQTKPGPKLKQEDMMLPEGTFDLNGVNKASKYFISTTVDYGNWSDRNSLLSDLPASDKTGPKGGSIEAHGTGGSNGCLSLSNTDAAFLAAYVQNNESTGTKASIDIFPSSLTDASIGSLSSIEDFKKYKGFWTKLKSTYDADEAKKASGTKTIDDILSTN